MKRSQGSATIKAATLLRQQNLDIQVDTACKVTSPSFTSEVITVYGSNMISGRCLDPEPERRGYHFLPRGRANNGACSIAIIAYNRTVHP